MNLSQTSDWRAGVTVLLEEIRRKALAVSKFYRDEGSIEDTRSQWPREAEIELIEGIVTENAQRITGQSEIPNSLWRRCGDFVHDVAGSWLRKNDDDTLSWEDKQHAYAYGESKFHEGVALWADHTLDFVKFLANSELDNSKVAAPVKILFLAANPFDTMSIRVDQELREIRDELERSEHRERFELHFRSAVRPKDFVRALLDISPSFVHFAGHGAKNGSIYMEDEGGRPIEVGPDALQSLFESTRDHVQCVMLNACFTKPQAHAIATHVPYVIGMTRDIGDQAAIKFAAGFYRALGAGCKIPDAYNLGLIELKIYNIPEYVTPVLISDRSLLVSNHRY
jgi:hypothetical protein